MKNYGLKGELREELSNSIKDVIKNFVINHPKTEIKGSDLIDVCMELVYEQSDYCCVPIIELIADKPKIPDDFNIELSIKIEKDNQQQFPVNV